MLSQPRTGGELVSIPDDENLRVGDAIAIEVAAQPIGAACDLVFVPNNEILGVDHKITVGISWKRPVFAEDHFIFEVFQNAEQTVPLIVNVENGRTIRLITVAVVDPIS
jgi:hypothetical protein